MALATLDDADFVKNAIMHLDSIVSQHNSMSDNLARNFFSQKKWIVENKARIASLLGVDITAEYDAKLALVEGSLTKLFSDGIQPQILAQIEKSVNPQIG